MNKTIQRTTGKPIFGATILAVFVLCASAVSLQAQTREGQEGVKPGKAAQYVYWTNSNNGTIGRATTTGTGVNEDFITTGEGVGGAGLTVDTNYIYWTGANGGSATNIGRANLDGSGVNDTFITGATNPCGVAVSATNIY
ncbi:MAG: hypothetical protein WB817_01630, partial [Terriglobales bacterium]